MADFVSSLDNVPILCSASSFGAPISVDDSEDGCSICLEPFHCQDPPAVTICKHEYHLHCILEWSQRSKECPICCQDLVLKDSASQELLAAVERERSLRSRCSARNIEDENEINHDVSYAEDSDFDERIVRHFAAVARRARDVNRRGRHRYPGIGPSELLLSIPTEDLPDVQHIHTTSPNERRNSSYEISECDSLNSMAHTLVNAQTSSFRVLDHMSLKSDSVHNKDDPNMRRELFSEGPVLSSSSEFLAISESIKSKVSAASARYKESISKSTRGFKEKLFSRNISVKELGREVQREMNAKIAGVSRLIERLDLTSKRDGLSIPLSNSAGGTSSYSFKGKGKEESVITQTPTITVRGTDNGMSSAASHYVKSTNPKQLEVPPSQGGN